MIAKTACAIGQYSTAGSTAGCLPCPAGFRCASPAAIPEQCPNGYYSPSGQDECTICPAGSYCADKAGSPTALTLPGTYAEAGATWFSEAEPGSLWLSFTQKPAACGDATGTLAGSGGSYWDVTTASCKICPINSFCPSNQSQAAIACPGGFYAPITGMTACLPCPAGFECPAGVIAKCSTTAGSFKYSYSMQSACVLCPAGYSCKDQASVPVICPVGTSSAAGEQTCAPCSTEGKECTGLDLSSTGSNCLTGNFRINQQTGAYGTGGQDYSLPVCRSCPPGYKCPSASSPPTPCNPGEYQNQFGQTTCIACSSTSVCPYRDALPFSCPTGYTANTFKTACISAPATPCSTTTNNFEFAWPNPGVCIKCPEGFECQSTFGPPRKCIPGYYSLAGAQYCTRCEAGSACPSEYGGQKVATCATGFYSIGGSLNCYPIPPKMSGTTTSKPTWCNFLAGEVSATGSATCAACGLNKQCPNDNLTPISCPSLEFTSRTDEYQCHPTISYGKLQIYPAVAVAPGMDVEVGIGKIGYRGMSTANGALFDAPPGYMAMYPFQQNWTQCPPGYYSPDLFWTCQPCPEGYNCPLRRNTSTVNNQGYWSPLGVHIPLVVPAGWKAGTTQPMQPCIPGEYSESNKSTCTKCSAGTVCPQNSNAPLACNEGFESKNDAPQGSGQFTCAPCDQNEYFDETTKVCTAITSGYGAIHPMFALQKCLFGQYSDATSTTTTGQVDCQPCTEGTICGSAATSAVGTACPNGYWCSTLDENRPQLRKYPCPAGTKAIAGTNKSKLEDACATCTAGNYCNGSNTAETPCPAGYFCPAGAKWSTQFPCLAGTKRTATGATQASDCLACTAGEYCPQGTATAFACPPQSACTNSTPVQDPAQDQCSDGTYPIGGICTTCTAGNFCITGVSTQQMCPAGRKRSTTGAKNRYEDCVECSAGELCPVYGMVLANTNYACVPGSGYICAIGTEFQQSFPCPAGTQDATTATSPALISSCVACPAGYACPEGTGTIATSNQKILCEPGYYCDGSITHPRQKPCTGGKYNPTRGSTSSTDCLNCSAGYYCPVGSYRQLKCPSGYYCPANTYDYNMFKCSAGTYRQDQQGASQAECTACPAGHYCEVSSVMPTFCPVGTYRDTTGAKSAYTSTATSVTAADSCLVCTAGYKCPFVGMTAALKCPAGYYSPAGSQVCFRCRAGFRCDTTSVTALSLTAYEAALSATFFTKVTSLSGVYTYSSGTCSKGYYCPEDALYEIACPVGTVNDQTGQTSIAACLNAADSYPGYYADQPGSYWELIVSNKCAPGYYCTGAAKSAYDKPCKVGMYTDKEGQSTCVVCTAGNYCLGGANNSCPAPCTTFYPTISYWPIVCPAGFFCEAGVNVVSTDATYYKNFPQPCPKGTYGGSVGLKMQSECTICDSGRFCAEVGAKSPTGLCDPGFYCVNSYDGVNNIGSTTPQPPNSGAAIPNDYQPLNSQIGGPCPIGGYCEAGSFQAKACPGGFYHYRDTTLAYIGLKTIFDCTVCPAGQYCGGTVSASAGQGAPTDYCEAGFYCQAQSTVKDQFPSPPGYYTRKGSQLPTQCEVGTYNNLWHMGDTNKNYPTVAPGEPGGTVVVNLTDQNIFYDPLGVVQHVHCPYCKEGFYCDQIGMSDNIKACPVGKFCTIGKFYKGVDALDASKSAWYTNPVSCLPGTYNPTPYATTIAHCLPCPPGKYCAGKALDTPSGDCLAGYFCKTGSLEQQPSIPDSSIDKKWGYCPEGSYCIQGTAYPAPCPPGTYGSTTTLQAANQCTLCKAGYYCPNASMKTADFATSTYQCEAGFYCPTGSKSPRASPCSAGKKCPAGSITETPCPNGYYQNNVQQPDCILCPAGYFCYSLTGTATPTICPAGSMCLAGCATNLGVKCSLGYWQPEIGRTFCFTCPTGMYCNQLGLKAPVGNCKDGYYCLTSSSSEQPTISSQGGVCTDRNYCPSGSVVPIPCDDGHFCTSTANFQMITANECSAGYVCYAAANINTPLDEASQGGSICPAGHYCLQATGSKDASNVVILPKRCDPGTYRANPGATVATDCLACPAGSYCESRGTGYAYDIDGFGKKIAVPVSLTVQTCDDGYICEIIAGVGATMPRPTGKQCPAGYKCNAGIKEVCGANYYQDYKGQSTCKPCPAGYQCPISTDGLNLYTTKIVCGQNFYCLNLFKDKSACTAGTYTLSKVAGQLSECINCPAGYICSTNTSAEPAVAVFTPCPAGRYCAEKTHAASPVVNCDKGYYCPLATPLMVPCPPGFACVTTGLPAKPVTADLCTPGYYCISASQSKTPTDGITGNICPAGNYCPSTELLPFPVPCPLGSFRSTTNGAAKTDCTVCTSDQFCDERGLKNFKAAAVVCSTGYYCPIVGPKIQCPAGAMCPLDQDRSIYIPCPAGQYQPNKLSLLCFSCPQGKYCPPLTSTDGLNKILHPSSTICPKGYYCPTKTEDYLPNPCPDGYYNPFDGGSGIGSCYKCPEGKMCQGTALTAITGDCAIGYYCSFDVVGQTICPAGTYCPVGSSYPTNCPLGTYQPLTAQGASSACKPCEAHKFCGERGVPDMTSSSAGNCGDGFLCLKGVSKGAMYPYPTVSQQGGLCTAGNYCSKSIPLGPQACPIGSYNPDIGQAVCKGCQKGVLCDTTGMQVAIECPVGYYCPAYSVTATYGKKACAMGTFNPSKNMGEQKDCLPCRLGSYCAGNGATDVTGPCNAGTYCPIGSTVQDATGLAVHIIGTNNEGPCPKGYMCPQATDAPLPCQPGTYNPLTGQTTCQPCPGGFYCDEQGMSDDTFNEKDKRCDAGYYCKLGATEPYPLADPTGKGDKCPPGNYCPQQSSAPLACAPGTFETRYSSYQCQVCPAGFYCPGATIEPIECVAGYCPVGSSAPKLCPDGTYADATFKRLSDQTGCAVCPNAQWCSSGVIQGFCSAGYWCNFGASSPNSFASKCEIGHFCPAGTVLPIRCPEGKYTATTGAKMSSDCVDCPPGYYCIKNDSVARSCPKGHICPSHSISPTPCFLGTYNPKTLKTASKDCLNCPSGYFCDERGIVDFNFYECPEGHYCPDVRQTRKPLNCPAGTYRNSTRAIDDLYDCWACNEGNFCNEGSIYPEPCEQGYACPLNSTKEYACSPGVYCPAMSPTSINCPAGYYCPSHRTYKYQKCGNGTYCPESSSYPKQCPAGTFGTGRTDNYDQLSSCIGCGLGQYSAMGTNACDDCWPGYVCIGNATKPNPTILKKDGGMICPAGFYCPKKSYTAIACPLATYNDEEGAGFLNMCRSCQEGEYGNIVGSTTCNKCAPGTTSSAGSTTCKCIGLNRKYIADQGKCVCQSGYEPVDGSAGNENGFTDCARMIYERCQPKQLRDSNGYCRNVTDCGGQCNGNGTISIDFGICECDNIPSIDSLCNPECQQRMPKVYLNSDGIIQIYDPLTNITTSATLQATAGQAKCAKKDPTLCTVTSIKMINDPNGNFGADFNLPTALPGNTNTQQRLINNLFVGGPTYIDLKYNATDFFWLNQPTKPESDPKTTSIFGDALPWYTSSPGGKRRLQSTTTIQKYIQNPIVCTTMGSSILFENLSNTSYPQYLRDSLLNTNDDFDYGQFIQLPTILKSGLIKNFIFTFAEQGVYVFGDSRNNEKQTIISVMGANGKCPEETQFLPQTANSLLRVNAKRRDVLMPPNWYFFFSVLVAFCLLILSFVLTIGFVVKRDWRQKYILPIEYQKSNYTAVERSDPEDKRAVVSINTEQMSIKFKHQNKRDVEEELIEANGDINLIKKSQKNKKKKEDVQLNQVEELKDRLARHAAELEKLFGKKKGLKLEDDDYEEEVDHDDSDLELEIDALYKLVQRNACLLKGEDVVIEENENRDFLEKNGEEDDAERRRREREEEERERERLKKEWMDAQNKKFEQDQADAIERAQYDFEDKKNTVLQQQLIESKEIGQTFSNRLQQYGADGQEINQYMNDLQNKMQNVEDLMHQDEDRQNDLLRMKLDARRAKRRKLEDKLEEVENVINNCEKETIDLQEAQLVIIQQELQEELLIIEDEEQKEILIIDEKLKMEKYDKLSEFEDKLKAAGSQKEFNLILAEYQKAQSDVEKELEKQRQKDVERLERDLKKRKALARANAQKRKQQAFQDIEDDQNAKIEAQLREQQDIKHVLLQEDAEDQAHLLADQLAAALKETSKGEDQDMENKRRLEKQQKAKHEREIVSIIGQDLKIEKDHDQQIQIEIEKLAKVFDPFQEKVHRRAELMNRLSDDLTKEEIAAVREQIKALDDEVRKELKKDEKIQDDALRAKLELRKRKKKEALERERAKKSELLQERIKTSLKNSDEYQVKKNDITFDIINEMIKNMQATMSESEVPAAIEKLIDEKHSRELQDLLLKMYEQKCVELKEEVLNMMQEKIARQQMARKNNHDRKRGIDAIISRSQDLKERARLEEKKVQLDQELEKELADIEKEYTKQELEMTIGIQKRTLNRENERVAQLQEEQLKEKNMIFNLYLPNSMLNAFLKDNADEERIELEKLRQDLQTINEERVKALEEEKKLIDLEVTAEYASITKLSSQDKKESERLEKLDRELNEEKRKQESKLTASQKIDEIIKEFQKDTQVLSSVQIQERLAQTEKAKKAIEDRRKLQDGIREKAEAEKEQKEKEAKDAREKQVAKITAERAKRDSLAKTIYNKQKILLKECYSRPLYHFNRVLHENQVQNEDFTWLNEAKNSEIQRESIDELLQKIEKLGQAIDKDLNALTKTRV